MRRHATFRNRGPSKFWDLHVPISTPSPDIPATSTFAAASRRMAESPSTYLAESPALGPTVRRKCHATYLITPEKEPAQGGCCGILKCLTRTAAASRASRRFPSRLDLRHSPRSQLLRFGTSSTAVLPSTQPLDTLRAEALNVLWIAGRSRFCKAPDFF